MRNICSPILKIGNSVGYPKMVTLPADNQSVSLSCQNVTRNEHVRGVMRIMLGKVASHSEFAGQALVGPVS